MFEHYHLGWLTLLQIETMTGFFHYASYSWCIQVRFRWSPCKFNYRF